MLVIMLRASVGNAAAGLAACVNMRDCIRVPVEMRAIAPLPPQHMASEANKHHSNRGFEYALLWLLCTAIFFRGGGRYSLDHYLGREL